MASQPELPPPAYYPPVDPKYQTVGSGWTGNYVGPSPYPLQQTILVQPLSTTMMTTSAIDTANHHHSFNIYNKSGLRNTGKGLIVVGILILILDVIGSSIDQYNYNYGFFSGLWCGIFFIIAGALAISAVKKNSKKRLKAMLAFSILSCMAVVVCIAFLSLQIENTPQQTTSSCSYSYYSYFYGSYQCYNYTYSYYYYPLQTAVITLSAFAIVFAIIEGIISIIQSAYGCCELCTDCCCPRSSVGPSIENQMHTPQVIAYNGQTQYPVLISTTTTSGVPFYPQQHIQLNSNI